MYENSSGRRSLALSHSQASRRRLAPRSLSGAKDLAEVRIDVSASRKSQSACSGGRIFVFELGVSPRPQGRHAPGIVSQAVMPRASLPAALRSVSLIKESARTFLT
jgi:hypothetical protein